MAEGHTVSNIPGTSNAGSNYYYNPNYVPYYNPVYPPTTSPYPVYIDFKSPLDIDNGPKELWALLYELREIKKLLQQILDKQRTLINAQIQQEITGKANRR